MPTDNIKKKDFLLSFLDTKYNFNYMSDYQLLSPIDIELKYKILLSLDDSWKYYYTNFKVIDNFYFKFELNIGKIFNKNIYFKIDTDRENHFLLNQIVVLSNSFIIKIFYVSKISSTTANIYRMVINYDSLSPNFAFIYEKNMNSLRVKIKSRKSEYIKLFSLKDFSFISFGFFMNDSNHLALNSIYFSDTYNLSNKNEDDKKIFTKCSKKNYLLSICASLDKKFCNLLYCKNCCKRSISFMDNSRKCVENCLDMLRNNLG